MRRKHIGIFAVLILWCASPVLAEEFGTLTGMVTDSATGEPVVGAPVMLEGTNYGALVDDNGFYHILNIPSGIYTMLIKCVGYGTIRIANTQITGNAETIQNVILAERAIALFVDFPRPKPPPNLSSVTGVNHILTPDELLKFPTRGYTEPAGLMPGAMHLFGGNNLHDAGVSIRAAYSDETWYYVDGIAQRDPATGTPITFMGNNAIDKITIANSSYNSGYGQASGGAVDVWTLRREPSWHGTVEAVTDNLHGESYDYNVYSVTLSGPLIPHSRRLYLGGALERGWYGDVAPRPVVGGMLPHNSSGLWNWQGKLDWRVAHEMHFSAGTMGSELEARLFSQAFYFNPEHAPRFTQKNYSGWAKFLHNVNRDTWYTLRANWFSTATESGDGVYFDDIWAYARPDANFTFDNTRLFYSGDNPNTPSGRDFEIRTDLQHGYGYITVTDTLGVTRDVVVRDERGFVRNGRYREDVDSAFASGENPWLTDYIVMDEFGAKYADESWVYEDYQKRKSSYKGFRVDFWHRLNRKHEFTGGVEFQYHTLRYYHHLFPHASYKDSVINGMWYDHGGFLDVDHYGYDKFGAESDTLSEGTAARHPYNYSLYLQDNFSLRELAIFAGLRFDVYHSNTKRLRWMVTPLGDPTDGIGDDNRLDPTDLVDAKAQVNLSPRFGIAFAINQKSVFHLSLGRFVQPPNLGEYYSGWDYLEYRLTSAGYFVPLGNAALEPTKSTTVELGLRHQLSQYAAVEVTGFYKDKGNQVGIGYYIVTPGASGRDFQMYGNGGNSTAQGLEFQLDLHDNKRFAAHVNFTLLDAEGTYAWPATQRNIVWTVSEGPVKIVPHPLEREYNLNALLTAQTGKKEGLHLGGFYPLANVGFGLVFRAGSGLPYSPMAMFNEVTLAAVSPVPGGDINSRHAPWVYQLDLKLCKEIPLGRWSRGQQTKMTVYLEVINVFDRKNALSVYQSTGQPDNCGWLETDAGQDWLNNDPGPDWTGYDREEKYHLKENDPLNYDTPRQIRLGMRVHF